MSLTRVVTLSSSLRGRECGDEDIELDKVVNITNFLNAKLLNIFYPEQIDRFLALFSSSFVSPSVFCLCSTRGLISTTARTFNFILSVYLNSIFANVRNFLDSV
jgi:hypothetical protein